MKPIYVVQLLALCFFLVALGAAFAQHGSKPILITAKISLNTKPIRGRKSSLRILWDARIKSAVDAQLAAKGWTQVDSGGDVAVVAMKASKTQRTLQTFYDGLGGAGAGEDSEAGGFLSESTTTEQDYKVGTLVVDLYDAKTKQLIWRGSAQDTLSDKAAKNEKNLDKGVAKMFKAFLRVRKKP